MSMLTFACFQLVLLVAGLLIGTFRRVGNINNWGHVVSYFDRIMDENLKVAYD